MMERYRFSDDEFSLMENSRIPLAVYQFIDKRVVTLVLSAGFLELFGYEDRAQAYYDMDNNMYKDTHTDDAARIADAAFRFATEGGKYEVIYRSKKKDGSYTIIHAQGEHIYTKTGVRLAQVWYTDEGCYNESDDSGNYSTYLTESLKNALFEESILKASYYDSLTGLPGMTYFFELAAAKRNEIEKEGGNPALMFMDFSGMKYFNHKFGFAEGDKLLLSFARLLAQHFGNENCSRLGQDHFAVIATEERLEMDLEELFEEVALLNDGKTLPLHVGVYIHWFEGIVASMACDRAKFACDTLKNLYSSQFSYYDMSMKDAEDRQQYIIANLDKAIAEGWIQVYYQPIVRAVNGRVCDEEALARWIDPVNGFMSPADFIPVLEDHRLIYKLDLYVVECVLKKIKRLSEEGLHLMPQSINLSRSDFDCCDIVAEIRRRVDAEGIDRSMLTIEITESVIGSDFDFMKSQIERFRENGFTVWMDDFGSGYSTLDVLQSVSFDLIKFDMRFMQKFSEGNTSKIILTELLKMATSLGIDTICEGVETEEQVQFLREAGCSKLQGYYFCKPIPVEKILERYSKGEQIGFENPEESRYFESIGRINLYDLTVIAQDNVNSFDNIFNSIPMAVIEINGDQSRFVRSNHSYREFTKRYFGLIIDNKEDSFRSNNANASALTTFTGALRQSCTDSGSIFIDERFSDGTTVHSCLRRIAQNPKTGTVATIVAVLSVMSSGQGTTFANFARALATDYFNLFYVDLETEDFFEYTSASGGEDIAMERRGDDFFNASRRDALKYLHEDDREHFVAAFRKENILKKLDTQGNFNLTYRLLMNGKPTYVSMKAMRMQNDQRHIIIGVRNIDSFMKQQIQLERSRRNESVFTRIMALSGDYICIYSIDPETDHYVEYSAADSFKGLGISKEGDGFFASALSYCNTFIHPDDRKMFAEAFSKEKVFKSIAETGLFVLNYRFLISGSFIPVTLKAAIVLEDDGERLLVGVSKASE